VVISTKAASVDNAILFEYCTAEVALEEPEIRSTDRNIPIENNCLDEELYFGMTWGKRDFKDECDESNERNAIPTARQLRWPATDLERFDLGTIDVDGNEGVDVDDTDADADEEEDASQADDGSTQNVED
jgi:hypothetical protein